MLSVVVIKIIFDCSSKVEDGDSHVVRNFDLNNIDSLSVDLLSGGDQDSYDVSSGYDRAEL